MRLLTTWCNGVKLEISTEKTLHQTITRQRGVRPTSGSNAGRKTKLTNRLTDAFNPTLYVGTGIMPVIRRAAIYWMRKSKPKESKKSGGVCDHKKRSSRDSRQQVVAGIDNFHQGENIMQSSSCTIESNIPRLDSLPQ